MIAKAWKRSARSSRRAGQLLTRMDILDIMNWLGTTLSRLAGQLRPPDAVR